MVSKPDAVGYSPLCEGGLLFKKVTVASHEARIFSGEIPTEELPTKEANCP